MCNGRLVEREGKNGKFLGCSNFPKCKYTERIPDPTDENEWYDPTKNCF